MPVVVASFLGTGNLGNKANKVAVKLSIQLTKSM